MRELERNRPITSIAPGTQLPALAILGAGRVGSSIAAAARRAGITAQLAGRDDGLEACRSAGAALLCVPDTAIAGAAETAAAAVPPLEFVGHVSGATGLAALRAASEAGAATFSIHPLQTVPDGHTDFSGAPCAISGSRTQAVDLARDLAEALGMRPFEVADEHRAAYHAAASIASNFLVALEESAAELLTAAGIADARELLAPLVLNSAAGWAERGAGALTGPIARGDEATVVRHLAALRETAPELIALYEALAERTRAIAKAAR